MLNLELVLEHDEIALALLVLHLLLERGAERVERVALGDDVLVREEADPAEAGHDALPVLDRLERGLGQNGLLEVLGARRGGSDDLLGGLLPGDAREVEDVERGLLEETNVDEDLDELGEALVPEGAADNGLGLGDVVPLLVGGRVTVGVGDEGEAGVDEVGAGLVHEVLAGDLDDGAILPPLAGVAKGEQDTARGPRELVAERVVRVLGGGETAAVRQEAKDLAALLVHLLDGLDGVKVVDTGVETDLVHDGDARGLGLGVKLHHGGRDIAGGDDILLVADGRLDDGGVEGVGDQADDEIVLSNDGIEGAVVGHIERDGVGVLDALGQLPCGVERPAG